MMPYPFAKTSRHGGFTIIELMVASVISIIVLTGVTAALVQSLRAWRAAGIRAELHMDLEISMERLRHDLRLSSVGEGLMAFYPEDAGDYTAISFPLATPNPDGFLERDEADNIIWNTTIIYHVRHGSPDELIRSRFYPRNPNATRADIHEQLLKVVQSTDLSDIENAAMDGERASSEIIFRNLVNLVFRAPEMRFDGYAPQYERARRINWGGIVLGEGVHELTFTVEGKNPDSTGYKVGVDRFALSYSASPREAEWFLPEHSRPADPYFRVTKSGGSMVAEDMSGYGASWSGGSQLTYTPDFGTAGTAGNQITFEVQNDLWNDTTFDSPPGDIALNCRRRVDTSFTNQAPYIPDVVIAMEEGLSWEVQNITADASNRNLESTEIISVLSPGSIFLNGSFARLQFGAGTGGGRLQVRNVYISEPVDIETLGTNIVSADFSWTPLLFSGNASVSIDGGLTEWTDWSPAPVPIDRNAGYLVKWEPNPGSADPVTHARVYQGDALMSYVDGIMTNEIAALRAMEVRAPSNAVYRSSVFDTGVALPNYSQLAWTRVAHGANGSIGVRVRSSDYPDMRDQSDADWYPAHYSLQNTGTDISFLSGRYVQYEAQFTVAGDHTQLPVLRDVTISWEPPMGIVDLFVDLARGPDYGIITAEVNSNAFIRGVEVDLEIFADGPYGVEQVQGIMEMRPMNTGR